jgi:uncharacterized OB-fold protein
MAEHSITPDYSALEIPMDAWSEPFWTAGAEGRIVMPRCGECGTFRWPAGPFCASCQSQAIEWVEPGQARIYSYTILPVPTGEGAPPRQRIPTLVAFDEAPGVRLVSALVDSPIDQVAIDASVEVHWLPAANAAVPVFKLSPAA